MNYPPSSPSIPPALPPPSPCLFLLPPSRLLVDWPRSINVFVASDSLAGTNVPLGYAYVPG
jgi:hypothetical protein